MIILPWVELDISDRVAVLPREDSTPLTTVSPPEVEPAICTAWDHELGVWGEAGLYWETLVILVPWQGEHGLALKGFYHPDHGPIGGEHHQLSVQAELDASPVTTSLNLVLEGWERSLVKTPHIIQLDLFTLHPNSKNQTLWVKTGYRTTLKIRKTFNQMEVLMTLG